MRKRKPVFVPEPVGAISPLRLTTPGNLNRFQIAVKVAPHTWQPKQGNDTKALRSWAAEKSKEVCSQEQLA